MKKIVTLAAAVLAAFGLVSCNKDQAPEPMAGNGIRLNITVADFGGPTTKAVKTGWESGDLINIWYAGNTQKDPDLVIKYDGSDWTIDESATVSGNQPEAEGNILYVYESGNNLGAYVCTTGEARYFGTPRLLYSENPWSPTEYTFADGTINFNIAADNWLPRTEFQVVVAGIDPSDYMLKCDNLSTTNGFYVSSSDVAMHNVGLDVYTKGVANDGGTAFYFSEAYYDTADYVFTLYDVDSETEYTYTAMGKSHEQYTFEAIKIDRSKFKSTVPEYEAVDLGLSVKWASFNVGAEKPEDYGYYFAWGETSPKNNYDWSNEGDYLWGVYDSSAFPRNGMTKYTADVTGGDGLKTLLPEDDAATKIWGEKWRTPTSDEIKELIDETKCEWTWDDTKKGYTVKGLNTGNSIFLPTAGYRFGTILVDAGTYGSYWSTALYVGSAPYAYHLFFSSFGPHLYNTWRVYGMSIRPVTE